MNYRHHFHAGNFADLLKHAVLLDLVAAMKARGAPLQLVETHAGAGLYALDGPASRRSGEAGQGISRLLAATDAPPSLVRLAEAVRAVNNAGPIRLYPGSPILGAQALRTGDHYLGCELRADDNAALRTALRHRPPRAGVGIETPLADGYLAVAGLAVDASARLVLIDPPFEQGDEADRLLWLVARLSRAPQTATAVWTPLKDLESFDRLRAGLDAVGKPGWFVELRLRPLDDPMRMNGCAMFVSGGPEVGASALSTATWIAASLGERGGGARLEPLRGMATLSSPECSG